MSRSTRPKNNRIYDESTALLEPIRFITARRFWILVYMLLGSTGLAMLIARVSHSTPFFLFPRKERNGLQQTDAEK